MVLAVLDWALIALSLMITILQLWLGLTVLLNAEHRTWGMWLSSGGLLTGAVFFVSHTAILGRGLTMLDTSMTYWWYLGLSSALVLPFTWYVIVLWYAGFWIAPDSALRRRHRVWLPLSVALTVVLAGLLIFANPFPSYAQVILLQISATPAIGGIPILIVVYAISAMLNIGWSLDALRQPGPARRAMGDLGRQRAHPWLLASGGMLLCVALIIAGVMVWVVLNAARRYGTGINESTELTISWIDLVISLCILLSTFFLGQAITSYEVFTGKTLPRSRLARHWQNVIILAAGFGVIMSSAFSRGTHPIYLLLLVAFFLTAGYTWFNWRSVRDRERYIAQLRPFLLSENLYTRMISPVTPDQVDVDGPFSILCEEVLGATVAYLVPLGPIVPLVGPPLTFPAFVPPVTIPDDEFRGASAQVMCFPINAAQHGGASWAVPLWSERGLIGVLLLGEKANDSLYTQEEIEIARASAERLIDMKASTEMARRLMELQRQRLAETNVVDNRTRRILHDDILPRLHTAMLTLSASKDSRQEVVQSLADTHHQIADLLHEMPISIVPEIAREGLVASLRRMVDKEWAKSFDEITWEVDPAAEFALRALSAMMGEVVYYASREAVRNAARHGRGEQASRKLRLKIQISCAAGLAITIADNGVGLNAQPVKRSAGGNGLVLHSTMMAIIGGTLTLDSVPGQGTTVQLALPLGLVPAGQALSTAAQPNDDPDHGYSQPSGN